jgi:hypothetical protein
VHTPRHAERMRKPDHLKTGNGDSDVRRFRIHQEIWDMYGDVVGDAGRAGDLRAYIEWRTENPRTPLPGKKRGPIKRWRETTRAKRLADGLPV